jgi:hypothetical protein
MQVMNLESSRSPHPLLMNTSLSTKEISNSPVVSQIVCLWNSSTSGEQNGRVPGQKKKGFESTRETRFTTTVLSAVGSADLTCGNSSTGRRASGG